MDIIISISFISSAKVHPRVTGGKRKENGEEKRGEGRVGCGGGRGTGQRCNKYEKTDNNCGPIHGCITDLSLWSVLSRTGTAPHQTEDTPSE